MKLVYRWDQRHRPQNIPNREYQQQSVITPYKVADRQKNRLASGTILSHGIYNYTVSYQAADCLLMLSTRKEFFIPVKVLSRLFRGKFLFYLKDAYRKERLKFPGSVKYLSEEREFNKFMDSLYKKEWVVYLKPLCNLYRGWTPQVEGSL